MTRWSKFRKCLLDLDRATFIKKKAISAAQVEKAFFLLILCRKKYILPAQSRKSIFPSHLHIGRQKYILSALSRKGFLLLYTSSERGIIFNFVLC